MLSASLRRNSGLVDEPPEPRHETLPGAGARRGIAWFALPIAVAALSGLWGSGTRQLWLDEYASWWGATLSWRDLLRLNSHIDSVQAPYYTLLHFWINVFGDSALAMRIPSIVGAVAAVACVMAIASRMYGRMTAILAGLVLAVVPYFALYEQTARPYSIAVAFACAASLQLARAIERPNIVRWLTYGVALVFLGAMHLVALLILPAHAAAVFVALRHSGFRKRLAASWVVAVAIPSLLLVPLIWRGHEQSFQIGQGVNNTNQAIFLVTYAFWSKMSAAVIVWGAVLGACFVRTARVQWTLAVAWAAFPYLFAVPTIGLLNLASLRYLLFALPPWVILACAAVSHLMVSPARHLRWIMPAVLALSLLCSIPGHIEVRRDPFVGYPDYRAAIASIVSRLKSGDGIAEAGPVSPGSRRIAVEYQFRGRAVQPRELFETASPQRAGWFVGDYCVTPESCVRPTTRVWLLTTSDQVDPLADTGFWILLADGSRQFGAQQGPYLRKHYAVASVDQFTGVRVALLTWKN